MVVCIHIPRFALSVAAGGARALAGRALALAPIAGGELRVGEVSGAAEAFGVAEGMAIGEALARCPHLELVPADPLAVAECWEEALRALEAIGAAVEPAHGATAYFDAEGLRGMYGGDAHTISLARRALARPARIGAAPTRFCALAAALSTGTRRANIIDSRQALRRLAAAPVGLLGYRADTAMLVEPLTRLGVRTLGEMLGLGACSRDSDLRDGSARSRDGNYRDGDYRDGNSRAMSARSRDALADRFGRAGVIAYDLAGGGDTPLTPRTVEDTLTESLEVGDASSGTMLRRVLGVLVDRLLARPERRGRTLRAVVLSASLQGGGTWRERVVFREALGDSKRVGLALSLRLALLPAPAEALRLEAESFAVAGGEQHTLLDQPTQARRERLGEAVCQVRAVAGHDAALRAVCIDPDSRVPERRVVLTPLPT